MKHVPRDGRRVADLCAKQACSLLASDCWLEQCPSFLISCLRADCNRMLLKQLRSPCSWQKEKRLGPGSKSPKKQSLNPSRNTLSFVSQSSSSSFPIDCPGSRRGQDPDSQSYSMNSQLDFFGYLHHINCPKGQNQWRQSRARLCLNSASPGFRLAEG